MPSAYGDAMKRRSAPGKPAKRRKPVAVKRRDAPKAAPRSNSSSSAVEVARLTRERDGALEQQAAASEVLQLISSSRGEVEPVFAAILESAVRVCDASFGDIGLWENDTFRLVAIHKMTPPAFAKERKQTKRISPVLNSPTARIVATKVPIHIPDLKQDRAYLERRSPSTIAAAELGGVRTFLGVPMLKGSELVGILFLCRQFVRPFTDKQIELVKNFAAQAVIAIENARLFNELRQRTSDLTERTTDLTEALEQQTATSEVLQVISSSPGDLEPVFATMLEKAVRICDAAFGNIYRWDSHALHLVASHNTPPAFVEYRNRSRSPPSPRNPITSMLSTKLWFMSPILRQMRPTLSAILMSSLASNWRERGRFSLSHC